MYSAENEALLAATVDGIVPIVTTGAALVMKTLALDCVTESDTLHHCVMRILYSFPFVILAVWSADAEMV